MSATTDAEAEQVIADAAAKLAAMDVELEARTRALDDLRRRREDFARRLRSIGIDDA